MNFLRSASITPSLRPSTTTTTWHPRWLILRRCIGNTVNGQDTTLRTDYEAKYAEKLQRLAQEKGLTVGELRIKLREAEAEAKAKARLAKELNLKTQQEAVTPHATQSTPSASSNTAQTVRKDTSPVGPLSSILNLPRLLATPHTVEQLSALWTAYHAARIGSGGHVCASIPLDTYERMMRVAVRYPSFVIPLPRINTSTSTSTSTDNSPACEFYFMEWAFHDAPPVPIVTDTHDLLSGAMQPRRVHDASDNGSNPRTSTVLFTPLREYKLRGAFATPHLVLTNYTDLARTHGVVLLRGEITPYSTASAIPAGQGLAQGKHLMSQQDAQVLAMGLQRFYLWGHGKDGVESEGGRLLKIFHESPEQFNWEELLKHADLTGS